MTADRPASLDKLYHLSLRPDELVRCSRLKLLLDQSLTKQILVGAPITD